MNHSTFKPWRTGADQSLPSQAPAAHWSPALSAIKWRSRMGKVHLATEKRAYWKCCCINDSIILMAAVSALPQQPVSAAWSTPNGHYSAIGTVFDNSQTLVYTRLAREVLKLYKKRRIPKVSCKERLSAHSVVLNHPCSVVNDLVGNALILSAECFAITAPWPQALSRLCHPPS